MQYLKTDQSQSKVNRSQSLSRYEMRLRLAHQMSQKTSVMVGNLADDLLNLVISDSLNTTQSYSGRKRYGR